VHTPFIAVGAFPSVTQEIIQRKIFSKSYKRLNTV